VIAKNENVTAEDGVFDTLARRAAGSMRDAQSLLEQLLSFAHQHIAITDVYEMLGTANDQLLFRLIEGALRGEQMKIFTELDTAVSQGVDLAVLIEQLIRLYRDMLVTISGGDKTLLMESSPQQFEQVKTLAAELGLHRILAAMQILDHTHSRMLRSTQSRVLMELALIRIANLDHFQQIAVLLEQLRSGQTALPAALPAPPGDTVKAVQRAIAPPKPSVSVSRNERIGLAGMDDQLAKSIWFYAVETIPGVLGRSAMKCVSIRFEMPNIFAAVFDDKSAKDSCEKESAQLQNVLSRSVGEAVKVRFELDAPKQEPQPQSLPRQSDQEQYRAATENPLVLKIQTAFGVTLLDVKR
jgi:DNA polymerase-3 subunit gamma/tau